MEIPEEYLLKCNDAVSLDISRNPGIQLNESIRQFQKVRNINLSHCTLHAIPKEICELIKLEELQLNSNVLTNGLDPVIGRLTQLKRLDLCMCCLTTLPDSIGNLTQLEELLLDSNDFSGGLNPAIGRLRLLKKLHLSECRIKSIPVNIGDLEQLEELNLYSNDFSEDLNEAIGRLNRLRKLDLRGCNLRALPDSIGDLEQLEELLLGNDAGWLQRSSNDFSMGICQAIGKLKRLKKLDLQNCKLKALPESVGNLEQLIELQLENNRLQSYPLCTLRLKNLKKLDISTDSTLYHLSIHYSKELSCIKQLPVELAYTNLDTLGLDGNPITEPPLEIWTQGLEAIKSYMQAIIPGGVLMHADTLNIIGDTGAGKTSVAQSLIERKPCPTADTDRTRVLQQFQMTIDKDLRHSVTINDFGGHEVYHSVMPIFLPTNGLAIIVFSLINEKQVQSVKKWVLTTIAKSKDIRIIIVGTHADEAGVQRIALEDFMCKFSSDVLDEAMKEVDAHIDHLQSRSDGRRSKVENLRRLRENLKNSQISVVTLSCTVIDDGLTKLFNLIAGSLRPKQNLPTRWFHVITDILNEEGLYLTMIRVQEICRERLTTADNSDALSTILRYLTKTSQIIWLENHPLLCNYIFHSPHKIVDMCSMVLHHDNEALAHLRPYYGNAVQEYENGVLLEPLLRKLLAGYTDNSPQSERQTTGNAHYSSSFDVVINFLQQFNLISCVGRSTEGRKFIVPCKLACAAPSILEEMERKGDECLNRVIVRLSFIGSTVPISLYETSLSSMLTAIIELAGQSATLLCLEIWKDGLIIKYDGVHFIARRLFQAITLSAFSTWSDASPWTLLLPVLERMHDDITWSWPGAPPHCAVVCPVCVRPGQSDNRLPRGADSGKCSVGEIQTDLTALVATCGQRQPRPTCKMCHKVIPRSLCFPTKTGDSFANEENEIHDLFNKDRKRSEMSTCNGKSRKQIKLTEPCSSTTSNTLSELQRKWFASASILSDNLETEEVRTTADHLIGKNHIRLSQWEAIKELKSRRESAMFLTRVVGQCGDETIEACLVYFENTDLVHLARQIRSACAP